MINEILTPLPEYPVVDPQYVRWSQVDRDGRGDPLSRRWPVRKLNATERATIRLRFDWSVTPPEIAEMNVAGSAALRLRAHQARGKLLGLSGSQLASEMWGLFVSNGPPPRYPWRGIEVLCLLDENATKTGVSVWLDAAPLSWNPRTYRPMRLIQRMAELEAN